MQIDCTSNGYYNETARCIISGNTIQVTACRDGYYDSTISSCVSNCGIGRYGEATYNDRGMVEISTCKSCDSTCYECAGSGPNKCLSCPKNFYLSVKKTNQGLYSVAG